MPSVTLPDGRVVSYDYTGAYNIGSVGSSSPSESSAAASSSTAQGYLDILKNYSTKDDFWMEKYLDALERLEDVKDARDYDLFVRSHSYQLMAEDLKKAGFNPYLALNSLGGSGGANIMKNASNYSASSARATQQNADSKSSQTGAYLVLGLIMAAARFLPLLALL